MSLVIIATKGTDAEQFGRFIEYLETSISTHNSGLESEGQNAGKPVDQNAFVSKAKELLKAKDLHGLLKHILTLENVLIADPRAAQSSFIILALLCSRIEKKDVQRQAVNDLIQYIFKRDESQNNLKFKLLASLFNTFPEGELKFETFRNILKLAEESNRPHILLVHLTNIDQYISQWNITKDQEIELYKRALNLINKSDDKYYKEKHQVYTKFLNALDAKFDTQVFNQNKQDIENIVLTILKSFPDHMDFNNLLELKPIAEVKNSNKVLHELFEINLNGDYQQFQKWNAGNSAFLKTNGISEAKIIDRVRLRSFFTLAHTKKTLQIKEVQSVLNLTDIEAEFWLIKALQSGHIDGKIDQLEGNIFINGIHDTSFKSGDWKDLENRLDSFKKTFEGFIEQLKKDK